MQNVQYISQQLFFSRIYKIQILITTAWYKSHEKTHYSWLKLAKAEAYSEPYHGTF